MKITKISFSIIIASFTAIINCGPTNSNPCDNELGCVCSYPDDITNCLSLGNYQPWCCVDHGGDSNLNCGQPKNCVPIPESPMLGANYCCPK